jgi:hypothetical protein
MLKEKIEEYIKSLEEQMEQTELSQDMDIKLLQHRTTLILVITDLKFMLSEEC